MKKNQERFFDESMYEFTDSADLIAASFSF